MGEPSGYRTARGSKTELADGSIFARSLESHLESWRWREDSSQNSAANPRYQIRPRMSSQKGGLSIAPVVSLYRGG